jgi:20S proteasome subunit beta 4
MSIFDRYHRDDISYEEGVDIIRKCIAELDKRLPIASGGYLYTIILWFPEADV